MIASINDFCYFFPEVDAAGIAAAEADAARVNLLIVLVKPAFSIVSIFLFISAKLLERSASDEKKKKQSASGEQLKKQLCKFARKRKKK
jgi:hypothetical protein